MAKLIPMRPNTTSKKLSGNVYPSQITTPAKKIIKKKK